MRVLFAVAIDLLTFCKGLLLSAWRRLMAPQDATATASTSVSLTLPSGSPPTKSVTAAALPPRLAAATPTSTTFTRGHKDMLVAVAHASLHTAPTVAFDNVVANLTYGTSLTIHKRSGRFHYVTAGDQSGWCLDEAVERSINVLPLLRHQTLYDQASEATKRLRLFMQDEFQAGAAALPLQPEEYVTYYLKRQGRLLPWPQRTARIAGSWHRKLKGAAGVHIDVVPRTGAIMEYVIDDVGYLAVIEAVTPDDTLHVSSVGLFGEGIYTELDLEAAQWQELQPVFIRCS